MAETPAVLFNESPAPSLPAPPVDRSRRYKRILLILFLCTLLLVNPIVHGDGVGYYAYVRVPLIEHNLDFTEDYLHANESFREARVDGIWAPRSKSAPRVSPQKPPVSRWHFRSPILCVGTAPANAQSLPVRFYCGKHQASLVLQSRASISSYSLLMAARSVTPTNWTKYPWGP